ncbi:MAG TPA: hypothetical protein VJH71_00850 [Candidatus Paceibacterota bacterium]
MTPEPLTIPGLKNSPEVYHGADFTPQLAQVYEKFRDFLLKIDYQSVVSDIRLIAVILSFVFAGLLIWIMIKMSDLYKKKIVEEIKQNIESLTPPAEAVTAYDRRWQEIKNHVGSFVQAEWKMAVIEADKFVDDVLKNSGFSGESMGERLMLIRPDQIVNIQYLWDAHKLRNLLVHDADFHLTHQQAIFAINAFESVLKELGALT